jgi:hypothetical protein
MNSAMAAHAITSLWVPPDTRRHTGVPRDKQSPLGCAYCIVSGVGGLRGLIIEAPVRPVAFPR